LPADALRELIDLLIESAPKDASGRHVKTYRSG
jgi:hypothetical protein